jgi:hypothetical protein
MVVVGEKEGKKLGKKSKNFELLIHIGAGYQNTNHGRENGKPKLASGELTVESELI